MKKFIKITIAFLCILIIILSVSYESILKKIGHYLILDQIPKKSDVIVVLNGRDTERCLAAVDLYNQGYADLIVLARGPKQYGSDEFWKRVGPDWDSTIFFQRAIEAMGIPKNSFKLIGNGVTSTYDEAVVANKFIVRNGFGSILLVTSKWHSKRAYFTFKSYFKDEPKVRITIHPSRYDSFNPNSWWQNEASAELVLREYVRMLYYFFSFRFL